MLKIVIIDDEKNALEALEWKLKKYIDDIEIVSCNSPIEGIACIEKTHPELVFLDIQMPEMDGFTLLEQLDYKDFKLIFTTAHDKFALQAIKVSAIDYLLKPIDKDELISAIEKVRKTTQENLEYKLQALLKSIHPKPHKINIAADNKIYLLDQNDVVMLKADKSYTTIFLKDNTQIIVSKTLKEVEKKFDYPQYYRVHHSYLINTNHVKEYRKGLGAELIMTNNLTASISRKKKNELISLLSLD